MEVTAIDEEPICQRSGKSTTLTSFEKRCPILEQTTCIERIAGELTIKNKRYRQDLGQHLLGRFSKRIVVCHK